ncbi:MAG: DNA primase large subunit PriL, partial [Thermoplasmata archaeon]|nr:DNA primase large subunit PriL [Thermoplasmata archaeon]
MELRTMASFPFLRESMDYLMKNPEEFASFGELAADMFYEGVKEKAMGRLLSALNREEIPIDFHSDEECREEILSYILSRVLVAATRDRHLIRWYSLAEAVRARKLLQGATMRFVLRVGEELGFEFDGSDQDSAEMGFVDYLRYASGLKSMEWKLTSQPLKNGQIRLERKKIVRLIQEALRARFEKELSEMKVPDSIKRLFANELAEIMGITSKLRESYEAQAISVVIPERFPPCIKGLIGMARAGENVPHSGRFAMTAFLHRIGMKTDEIVDIFRVSPDFREDLARYQVEHITGSISGTDYESMACKTMTTYGLCTGRDEL